MLSTLNFSNLWSVDRKPDFAVHEQQNRVCDQPTTDSKNSGSKAYTLKRNLVFFFEIRNTLCETHPLREIGIAKC